MDYDLGLSAKSFTENRVFEFIFVSTPCQAESHFFGVFNDCEGPPSPSISCLTKANFVNTTCW